MNALDHEFILLATKNQSAIQMCIKFYVYNDNRHDDIRFDEIFSHKNQMKTSTMTITISNHNFMNCRKKTQSITEILFRFISKLNSADIWCNDKSEVKRGLSANFDNNNGQFFFRITSKVHGRHFLH